MTCTSKLIESIDLVMFVIQCGSLHLSSDLTRKTTLEYPSIFLAKFANREM